MRNQLLLLAILVLSSGCVLDKQKHFVVGAAISSWVYAETSDRSKACLAALGAGVAKEIVDSRHGDADHNDAFATLGGCTVTWVWD